jgi:hypothetical protein
MTSSATRPTIVGSCSSTLWRITRFVVASADSAETSPRLTLRSRAATRATNVLAIELGNIHPRVVSEIAIEY